GGYGGDPGEQFHRNEAISAVVDEGFLGEEDDDYEDLYNDVNVGENFMQSYRRNEDEAGRENKEVQESRANVEPLPPPPDTGGGSAFVGEGTSYMVSGSSDGHQTAGLRNNSNGDVAGGGDFRGEVRHSTVKPPEFENTTAATNIRPAFQQLQPYAENANGAVGNVYGFDPTGGGYGGAADGAGGTFLFVGDLHWWTTDADLESEICKYGVIKELKIYDERSSGKSKGYCHVEFYDPAAAAACKEGMNGHPFNGRPCNIQYATPYSIKRLGDAQAGRNQQQMGSQMGPMALNQPRRPPGDFPAKPGGILGSVPNNGDNNGRAFGRGNWSRGNPPQGVMGNRGGPMAQIRSRAGGMGGRGLAGNGNGFGSGLPMMHPQALMAQGFDPTFGGPMGRMAAYGGFPGGPGAAPFPGMFGPVGNVGMPGVAPHVNPAFFGRGMSLGGGMNMMSNPGVEGANNNVGMWQDPNFGGWSGVGESSYNEEVASEHPRGEESQDRGQRPGNAKEEKEKGSEKRDWSGGSSEKRLRDERPGYEKDVRDRPEKRSHENEKDSGRDRERGRDRHRDDRDRYSDRHKHHSRDAKYDDNHRDRGRSSSSSTAHGKSSRSSHGEDAEYAKRRR
ncbi:hypothetical protein M569_05640, partial [Genlisea aurea]